MTRRSSSLADRLAKMASTADDPGTDDAASDAGPAERPLKVAPAPADSNDDEPGRTEPTEPEAAEATPDEPGVAPGSGGGEGPVQTAKVLASPAGLTSDPAPGDEPQVEERPEVDEPVVEEKPAPRRRKATTTTTSGTTTSGTTSTETAPEPPAASSGPVLHHLAETMGRGRNQRRWVEDNLPHRSERGTFMRLPVHLLDVLDEYCDRKDLPQQDFVAAVLDSYFRDLGALPPLGAGHHPDERFFTELRRQARSRDY